MYAWPKFHGSSPYSLWENDLNAKNSKKSQWTVKGRSCLKIEHRVDLNSSWCMHDPSFMAPVLIISEKMTSTQKSLRGLRWRWRQKSNTYVLLLLRRQDKNRDFLLLCHYLQMDYITETRTRNPNWYNFPINLQGHSGWVIIVFLSHLYNGKSIFFDFMFTFLGSPSRNRVYP